MDGFPKLQYRIPRIAGHVRIIKTYQGKRVTDIRIERAADSQRRVDQELAALGYTTPNTSAVERHNGTARRMNPYQVRRSLAFARLPHVRQTVSDLVNGVYNFCRVNRSLRVRLDEPVDAVNLRSGHQRWPSGSRTRCGACCACLVPWSCRPHVGHSSTQLPACASNADLFLRLACCISPAISRTSGTDRYT